MSTATDEETQTQDDAPQVPVEGGDNDDETPPGMTPDGEPGPADDDAAEDEPEGEPEEEQPQGPSQKEIDAKTSKLEKASSAYIKKVTEILGDDISDFVPSPLSTPFLFGFVFNPSMVPLDESVVNATKALIGDPVPPPLKQDSKSQECPDCEGWGQVLTGSKVHPFNTAKCVPCKGRGTVGERFNLTVEQVAAGVTPESIDADNEPVALLSEDNWGTPLGHPDYGKMPQYREPGWAEALEAYKRGEAAPVA